MKKTLTLLGLWIVLGVASQAVAQNVGTPSAEVAPKKARPTYYDNHPEMYAALQSLKEGIVQLKKAGGGKGGHRAQAMKKIREAMKDIRKGVEFANSKLPPEERRKMQAELKAEEKEIEAMIAE
ncbi:MAG: hypothetical protein SNJ55_02660 [Chloroherpetonaceae bacterium]